MANFKALAMVKMAARVLKIGMHLGFDPKFTVEFEHFDQKYFRQAYWPGMENKLFHTTNLPAAYFSTSLLLVL